MQEASYRVMLGRVTCQVEVPCGWPSTHNGAAKTDQIPARDESVRPPLATEIWN